MNHQAVVSLDVVVGGYNGCHAVLILHSRVRGCWCGRRRLHLRAPAAAYRASDFSVTREAARSSTMVNVFPARTIARFPLGASEITLVLALSNGGSGTDILARIARY